MSTPHFAYHLKSDNFQGNFIYPMNQLQKLYPEIAKQSIKKYDYRKALLEKVVFEPTSSPLTFMGDTTLKWLDVSFSSMIDPNLIFRKVKDLNLMSKDKKIQAFKIPIERFSTKTMVWLGLKSSDNPLLIPQDDTVSLLEAYDLIDINVLPVKTITYFESWHDPDKKPLTFVHMPHILTPEPIDIGGCEIIEVG